VVLAGCVEGMLPFKPEDDGGKGVASEAFTQRLQEERRLMYVGITRAQRSLAVSWSKKRKKGREMVAAQPSRFIAEMALDQATTKENPRDKLKALRAEFAKKAEASAEAAAAAASPQGIG
jgi:ATP-dependent DNA helicase Rep